jgi:predicted RNase H-like HicB family nuclease
VHDHLRHGEARLDTMQRMPWYDHPMGQMKLTAVYMKVPKGYIGFVEELPGANTQGETLEEARAILEEAVAMVLAANRELSEESPKGA